MKVLDSRRLTGSSLVLDRPGAVLDVQLDPAAAPAVIAGWRSAARRILDAIGWAGETLSVRTYPGGASLALSAPVDALYAATEVNEWAWEAALASAAGGAMPSLPEAADRLHQAIAAERNPALLDLRDAARSRGFTFLSGEEQVSVGAGTGAQVWPEAALPAVADVNWARVHDIPIALVTGSNGKTTVVRLVAAMLTEAGRDAGTTTTDGVSLRGVPLAQGDFSGPSGARLLLRHPEVEVAVLETARGGLLRRGLPVERADVAVVTNVADDHLGEFGIGDLDALADVKLLVARALGERGTLVANADDARIRTRAGSHRGPVIWFSLESTQPVVARHLDAGGRATIEDGEALVLAAGAAREAILPVAEVPIAVGGAARHNVANALAALAAAWALGVAPEAMRRALRRFGRATNDNVGRANVVMLDGVRVVVDYAHNPHGMAAMAAMVSDVPAARRLVLIGQAGDRSDEAIRALARAALALHPDRVVIKEMPEYLRGRSSGEVPALLADEVARGGMPEAAIALPGGELESVRDALRWARPGDLLLLTVHQNRPAVLALLERLRMSGWRTGQPLPASD